MQIISALPQHLIIKLLFVFLVVFVLFLVIIYIIGYFSSSRHYKFYRQWDGISVTVTRYFMGLFPIHKKTFAGLKQIEVEEYIQHYDDSSQTRDCARIYAILKPSNQSSKRMLLSRIAISSHESEVHKTACDIKNFIQSRQLNTLVMHNYRMGSFAIASFAYAVSIPFVLTYLWSFGAVSINFLAPDINESLTQQAAIADNKSEVYSAPPIYSVSDLPATFPIIDNTIITQVQFNDANSTWVVWLDANSYDSIKLHEVIKNAVHAKGWQTSRTEDFPTYARQGNSEPDSGYIFYIRNAEHTLEGDVVITKGVNGLTSVISVPVTVPPPTDQPTS